MEMEIRQERRGDVLTFYLTGEFNKLTAEEFDKEFATQGAGDVRLDFSEDMAVSEFLPRLEARVAERMQYRKGLDAIYEEDLEGECATFILQKGSMGRRGGVKLGDTQTVIEELPANEISAAENVLDIELNAHDDGTYALVLSYDIERYSRQAMQKYARMVQDMVQAMQDGEKKLSELL